MRFNLGIVITFILLGLPQIISSSVIGVDYGQDYSKAVVIGPQAPLEIVLTDDSKRKQLTGVLIKSLGATAKNDDIERFYGSDIQSYMTRFPQNTITGLKKLLGISNTNDVPQLYRKMHPGLEIINKTTTGTSSKKNKSNGISIMVDGIEYPIEELIAMDLEQIISRGEEIFSKKSRSSNNNKKTYYGNALEHLGLTIPTHYTEEQRQNLIDSAKLLHNIRDFSGFVDDGLTVAINYALKRKHEFEINKDNGGKYLIYDSGADSTKASLVEISSVNDTLTVELIGYGYNSVISGNQLTLELANLITSKFLEQYETKVTLDDLNKHYKAQSKILQAAEKCKLVLSANAEAHVSIESLYSDDFDFRTKITRAEFESLILSKYNNDILEPIEQSFELLTAGNDTLHISLEDLNSIILTGGSSRVPYIQSVLTDYVANPDLLSRSVNADESSVNGLVFKTVQLSNAFAFKQKINVIDRSVYEYSLNYNGMNYTIFPKGSEFPSEKTILLLPEENANRSKEFVFKLGEFSQPKDIGFSKEVKIKNIYGNTNSNFNLSNCEGEEYGFNATFQLDANRIFNVVNVEPICLIPKVPTEGAKFKTNSTVAVKNNKKKSIKLTINSATYPASKRTPLSNFEVSKMKQHLQNLTFKDEQRKIIQEKLNALESKLYEFRSFLEEYDDQDTIPNDEFITANNLITDYLEWLDFDSAGCTTKDISGKLGNVTTVFNRISKIIKSTEEDLSFDLFEQYLSEGEEFVYNMTQLEEQEAEDTLALSKEFQELELGDVIEEYSKVEIPKYIGEKYNVFKKNYQRFIAILEKIHDLLEEHEDSFDKLDKLGLYELKESYLDLYEKKLPYYLKNAQAKHVYIIKALRGKITKKLRNMKREQERQQFKLNNGTHSSVNSTDTFSSVSNSSVSTSTSTSTSTILEHDEL
ncbi:uncharacterized protein SCODWIG_02012 [Saccharomycodes ludwigii]|uniref:Heat shock protein 70 homolog LHS1 n=1 Tax=Saccharomycodes ludwigii TaxID=36035 RepID=A0A376B6I8_9ASCO|nr:uncharacterized protein SCODWIG_02012 [Saccharomycodes ludwigii]